MDTPKFMVLKEKKKINWKKGAGELLSFAIVVPIILILVCAVFSAAQISTANEQLNYAAYSICRAAVVSDSANTAEKRAEAVMDQIYPENHGVVFLNNEHLATSVPTMKPKEAYCELQYIGKDSMWTKGDMIQCTVYQYVNPITPFTAGVRSQTIVMMIEHVGEMQDR